MSEDPDIPLPFPLENSNLLKFLTRYNYKRTLAPLPFNKQNNSLDHPSENSYNIILARVIIDFFCATDNVDIARRVVLILAQSIVSFYIRLLTLLFVYMVMKCLKISFQLI